MGIGGKVEEKELGQLWKNFRFSFQNSSIGGVMNLNALEKNQSFGNHPLPISTGITAIFSSDFFFRLSVCTVDSFVSDDFFV